MTSLKPNLVKRIDRLPKPSSVAAAMQPLFEAISNAIHSTQARFTEKVSEKGRVTVTVFTNRDKKDVWASVEDNGFGLNDENWEAFTTTDTDNKIRIGGKGVGRLLWLDCFEDINISSVYRSGSSTKKRDFKFVLALEEQIKDENVSCVSSASETSFFVKFKDLRPNGYLQKFPGRESYVFQHLTSHFLPIFIGGRCPIITVSVGSETRVYPEAIKDIVHRRLPDIEIPTEEYGLLKLTLMECDKVASSDLKGSHFIHLIAHDRTVHSQSIDGKLGLKYFGTNGDRVFHGILVGEYLDTNVNQERTAFTFEDSIIDKIINDVCDPHIRSFLSQPLEKLKIEQGRIIELITSTYPSIAFGTADELQQKIPAGEMSNDAIYGHLSREKYRRDERQATKIRGVLSRLKGSAGDADTFTSAIKDATAALEEAEQKSLAEYVVRRKVVLDFIELLLEKVRDASSDSAYQREDILHSFICPLRINNISNGQTGRQVQAAASHDLWIIDERLTFAEYFSSDVEFSALAETYNSEDRADILVFDHVHGLRQTNGHSRVLLVEFKRPGREAYADNENPIEQVNRYIRRLQTNQLKDVRGRPLNIDGHTIFHAFVIADIVGKIDDWTYNWDRTADGRGRMNSSKHGYVGTIEVMGWDALIADAKARDLPPDLP